MIQLKATRRNVLIGFAAASALPSWSLAQGDPVRGGVLKVSHSTRIATLNVLNLSGPAEYPCVDMIFSGLTRMGEGFGPVPDLAESWEGNEDGTVFHFHLRPNVTFHDGTPLTADDVVATMNAILDPATGSGARSVLDMIETVEAVDSLTVRFGLSIPYADLPTSLAHSNARIVSAAAIAGPIG